MLENHESIKLKIIIFADSIIIFSFLFFSSSCEKITYYQDRTQPSFSFQPDYVGLTSIEALIYWVTDEACQSTIKYYFSGNIQYPTLVKIEEYMEEYYFTIDNLWPNIEYYLIVEIVDYAGNKPVVSDTLVFRTWSNELSYTWDLLAINEVNSAKNIINVWAVNNPPDKYISFTKAWVDFRNNMVEDSKEQMIEIYQKYPKFLPNLAGLTVIFHLLGDYNEVINYANKLLSLNNYWIFEYTHSKLNFKFVRLMLAEAYLNIGYPQKSQEQLDLIWDGKKIDPEASDTWIVNGVKYTTYESAQIALINYLFSVL